MQVPLVMTIIGKDRPGLVESLANLIAKHGGNWLESRMCRLGGEFAGILRVVVDSGEAGVLQNELRAVPGLMVTVATGGKEEPASGTRLAALELVGQDRPGIVREISRALAARGINVEELSTECSSAPMSGETLFKAEAKLRLPQKCALAELRADLERIGGNLLVDVRVEEL